MTHYLAKQLFSSVPFEPARVEVPAFVVSAGCVVPARNLEHESTGVANAEFVLNLLETRGESELASAAHRKRPRVDLSEVGRDSSLFDLSALSGW